MSMAPQVQAEHEHDHPLGASDHAMQAFVVLSFLLMALMLASVVEEAVRELLRRCHRGRVGSDGSGERDNNADPENPAECTICLTVFVDGDDAVRVMPACRHSFHASCIERWLAGGRRSTCPTCRGPATVAAATARPDEATNCASARYVAFVILSALQITALVLFMYYRLQGK